MQKRIVRKLDLERFLSQIEPHPSPRASLEQYTIPVNTAATMLYLATYKYGDIARKTVLDLGCGTGRLALGAVFLGAEWSVGVDIDKVAVHVANQATSAAGFRNEVCWAVADIHALRGNFDTVLQNPPYGVQKRGADMAFVEKALMMGKRVYSLHKGTAFGKEEIAKVKAAPDGIIRAEPNAFIERRINDCQGKIVDVYEMLMAVPHMFGFHTRMKHEFVVDLYVIETSVGRS